MNTLKKLSIMIIMVLLPHLACTKDSKQIQVNAQTVNSELAVNNSSSADDKGAISKTDVKVFNIKEVINAIGNKVADFTFEQDGKLVSFSELTKGKIVFLNFWGTWCPPCRGEIPDIISISKDLKNKDFIVIGIALEKVQPNQALSKVADFAKSNGIDYHIFIGNQQIVQAYGDIPSVPTTFIIDKSGSIVETLIGGKDKETFMKTITKYLK
jgi:thiol-disulfide isomerase/thioredoxin